MTSKFRPVGRELAVFLGYCTLAVVLTWPLARYLGSALPGVGADPVRAYWYKWWMSYALSTGSESVLHTPMIFHPEGTPALLGLFGFLYTAVSLIVPYLQSYNLLFLMMFALSAYGCYRLALYMLNDRKAAIYAGVIFGLSPFMLGKGLGHCGMLQAVTIPLAMLEMFKALDTNKYAPKRA
ncbi:MAG: hypothetical protein HQ568_03310, partial [Calditrichaeota bacterium]|nr:hypothetical protein [Calditrichota bacterium]